MQSYTIANMKANGQVVPNQKMMNSDEILQFNEINQIVPKISHHTYKKSMVNPKQLRPALEIQLPEQEPDLMKQYASLIKKDSTTHKTAAFLPN